MLPLEFEFGQMHPLVPEKSGSENFTQNLHDYMSNTVSLSDFKRNNYFRDRFAVTPCLN